jgi:hypothetical protein
MILCNFFSLWTRPRNQVVKSAAAHLSASQLLSDGEKLAHPRRGIPRGRETVDNGVKPTLAHVRNWANRIVG